MLKSRIRCPGSLASDFECMLKVPRKSKSARDIPGDPSPKRGAQDDRFGSDFIHSQPSHRIPCHFRDIFSLLIIKIWGTRSKILGQLFRIFDTVAGLRQTISGPAHPQKGSFEHFRVDDGSLTFA